MNQMEESTNTAEAVVLKPAVTTRFGRSVMKPSCYLAVTKVSQKDWKEEAVIKAIKVKLVMLFDDLNLWWQSI
jgi:hypothetical protein